MYSYTPLNFDVISSPEEASANTKTMPSGKVILAGDLITVNYNMGTGDANFGLYLKGWDTNTSNGDPDYWVKVGDRGHNLNFDFLISAQGFNDYVSTTFIVPGNKGKTYRLAKIVVDSASEDAAGLDVRLDILSKVIY